MKTSPRKKKIVQERTTGLSRHATVVSFASARALTSHIRRLYRERYEGRYRFSKLVYAFDVFLVGAAVTLLCTALLYTFSVSLISRSGLDLVFSAPQIRVSDSTPLSAVVSVTDERSHADLRLTWVLPSWVEIVRANPPISKDGTVHLGDIRPGQIVRSDILVRARIAQGTRIPIAFTLSQFHVLGDSRVSGVETRIAGATVLTAMPAITERSAVPSASIPFIVTNAGNDPVPSAVFRLVKHEGAGAARISGSDAIYLGTMPGHASRIVFVDLGVPESDHVTLGWQVQDGAQVVDAGERAYQILPSDQIPDGMTGDVVNASGTSSLHISIPTPFRGHLFVVPAGSEPFMLIDIRHADPTIDIPFPISSTTTPGAWSILPITEAGTIGQRIFGRISSSIPFSVSARYYSSVGDQIGVGPLPPKVGEDTTYWIVWSVGPTDVAIKGFQITAALPSHVSATGKFASSYGGVFTASETDVSWDVPLLASTAGATATFAFEVRARPAIGDVGTAMTLLRSSRVRGADAVTGEPLRSSFSEITTDLIDDVKASGKGKVIQKESDSQ